MIVSNLNISGIELCDILLYSNSFEYIFMCMYVVLLY